MINNITFIAEVKTQSPFGFQSSMSWSELFDIANEYGDIISIHTNEYWGGSFKLIEKARKMTNKPILAKGVHERDGDIRLAVDLGANYVLVVGRIPEVFREKCLIEPNSLADLSTIPQHMKVVWNSRDINTGGVKQETFSEARTIWNGWLCQASNIRTAADINHEANAILVGEHLAEFVRSL